MNDGFKDTEIGRIPREWEIKRFDECISTPKPNPKNIPKSQFKLYGKYPIIDQGAEFISGYTNDYNMIFKYPLPVIIFGDHTRIFKFINFPFAIGADGTKILIPKTKNLDGKFLYFQFISFRIQNRGYNRHFRILRRFLIKVPSLEEQKRIAYVLSKIHNAIEIQDKLIRLLQELKKTMMHKLFTEGIGHTEFKDTEIGRIPKEWEIKKISELFSIQHGISITPARRKFKPNYPMLRTINVEWGKISLEKLDYSWFSEKEIENLNLEYGDLLLCEGGDIGRTAMWREERKKVGYQNHLHRLRKINKDTQPLFYMYWLQYAILH